MAANICKGDFTRMQSYERVRPVGYQCSKEKEKTSAEEPTHSMNNTTIASKNTQGVTLERTQVLGSDQTA
ncbi:hypothetical protein CLAIMM_03830 [Cladophialophora immunda]|nr:hypothetical protein CLAIMM_03830 [Cladophialophora immunda]